MFKKLIFFCFCFLLISYSFAQSSKPKAVIFDSDMGPDYDDAGAIALLHAFADSGYIKILATVASTKYNGVAGVFDVFNTYFGRPDIPIGVPKKNGLELRDWQHWSDTLLAKYPHSINSNDDVPDAVDVYREVLAKQPDKSVTIITVGFFTNLSNLLQSKPDQYSPLSGAQLVQKKVKLLVSMAGRFPSGKEFNIEKDAAASQYVFSHWTTPVVFSGFEIGQKIKAGLPLIQNEQIQNSPVKDVFRICIPMANEDSAGRMSWDETAVFVAIAGWKPYYKLTNGTIQINDDGSNTWSDQGNKHFYLVEDKPASEVQDIINKMMMHQPKR